MHFTLTGLCRARAAFEYAFESTATRAAGSEGAVLEVAWVTGRAINGPVLHFRPHANACNFAAR